MKYVSIHLTHIKLASSKSQLHGTVNFGASLDDPAFGKASQVLVFIIVSINEEWKIPVGYFFIQLQVHKKQS
jgi:hypothetical protein